MIKGLYNSAISLHTRMKNLQIISNNLANANTTGFKREVPFSEYLSREDGMQVKQITDFSDGSLSATGNPFDLAISGEGFFMIDTANGIELTKNGKFSINSEGYLIDANGDKVITNNGGLNIYESLVDKKREILITKEGEIKQGEIVIDKLLIAKVDSQEGMRRSDNQHFVLEDLNYSPAEDDDYQIYQGYLEESNTNPIIELENMIKVNKDFEASQKAIRSLDNILAQSKEIGRV